MKTRVAAGCPIFSIEDVERQSSCGDPFLEWQCAVGLNITGQFYLPLYWTRLKHITKPESRGNSMKSIFTRFVFKPNLIPTTLHIARDEFFPCDISNSLRIVREEFFLYLWQICLVFARQFIIWRFSTLSLHKTQMFETFLITIFSGQSSHPIWSPRWSLTLIQGVPFLK